MLSKQHNAHRLKQNMFESIDNQYNCLGIDENEAKNYLSQFKEQNVEMMHSQDDCANPQDRSSILQYCENYKMQDPFGMYNEGCIASKLPYLKHKDEASDEIVVVNDSDNEIVVPQGMEVQHLEVSENDFDE